MILVNTSNELVEIKLPYNSSYTLRPGEQADFPVVLNLEDIKELVTIRHDLTEVVGNKPFIR